MKKQIFTFAIIIIAVIVLVFSVKASYDYLMGFYTPDNSSTTLNIPSPTNNKSSANNESNKVQSTPATGESEKTNEKNEKTQILPDFTVTDLQGNPVKLSDYKDKIVVINFWATWCPPCKAEMPEFNELAQEFKKDGDVELLEITLVDDRSNKESVLQFISENNLDMNILLDDTGEAASTYGISAIPTTLVAGKNLELHKFFQGQITKDVLLQTVNEVRNKINS